MFPIVSQSLARDMRDRRAILLFYKEYERDKFVPYDRYLKRVLRPAYNLMHSNQKKTGFAVSFDLLRRALIKAGWNVRVNDYALARRYPDYPVGLVGFPDLLDGWSLPNPALLGPSLYDHPKIAPDLMKDPRYRRYLVLADWTLKLFQDTYGDLCTPWFAGIDLEEWPDLSGHPKDLDFLVYDKIRWGHDRLDVELLQPILATLRERGFSHRVVRYKHHDHATYRQLLARSRGMIFLCEHETQGLAYQEALASGVPVLAWDNGFWQDPLWKRFGARVPASSVPFFGPECGRTFSSIEEFPTALSNFLEARPTFHPRRWVAQHLTLQTSADIYSRTYFSIPENGPSDSGRNSNFTP